MADAQSNSLEAEHSQRTAFLQRYRLSEEQEYETQFFGFTPKSFCDGMYNAILEYSCECLSAAEECIKTQFTSMKEEELSKGREALVRCFTKVLDRAMDKTESYLLCNILYLPNTVVLPEDQIQEKHRDFTKENYLQLDKDIELLKEKIKATKYCNASLRQELDDAEKVHKSYDEFLDSLAEQDKAMREAGVSDIRESLLFIKDKTSKVSTILSRILASTVSQKRIASATSDEERMKQLRLCPRDVP